MIESYVNELGAHLRVGHRRRARILAEVADHLADASAGPGGLPDLGERLIETARRRPAFYCAAVAASGSATAMSHAETTAVGALP